MKITNHKEYVDETKYAVQKVYKLYKWILLKIIVWICEVRKGNERFNSKHYKGENIKTISERKIRKG